MILLLFNNSRHFQFFHPLPIPRALPGEHLPPRTAVRWTAA